MRVARVSCAIAVLGACGRYGFDPLGTVGSAWTWQIELAFDNGARAEDLLDVPVMVTLDPARIDYTQMAPDGADLRFVAPGGTALPYEIEAWAPGGTSIVWVRVPSIAARSTTDHILLVFGNPSAADAQDAAAVWTGYAGVWHMASVAGGVVVDSTANANHGQYRAADPPSKLAAGIVGPALEFDGASDYIEVPDSDSLDVQTFTISGWVKVPIIGQSFAIAAKDDVGVDTTGAYHIGAFADGSVQYQTNNLSPAPSVRACCLGAGAWGHFTFTLDAEPRSRAYFDGQFAQDHADVAAGVLPTSLLIARRGNPASLLAGELDELRIEPSVRSDAWISAQYASMTDTLITYGAASPR